MSVMSSKALTAYPSEQESLGFFRIFATPPGSFSREITLFRDAPVQIGNVVTQDPFTEVTAGLTLPQVTVFDAPGEGDLDWLVPNSDIDIVWQNTGGYDFDWRWEGYIASYSFNLSGSESSFSIDLKGAFYGLDDYLAIPGFPNRPIPYEILIAQAFDQTEHPAHLGKFRISFPPTGTSGYRRSRPQVPLALKPWGVATDQVWTGFTSVNRILGAAADWARAVLAHGDVRRGREPSGASATAASAGLSSTCARSRNSRRPDHRDLPGCSGGVTMDGSRDFTQRAGVIYGAGRDEAGISSPTSRFPLTDGTTYYEPFAYSNRMWPRKNNPSYDPTAKPKEDDPVPGWSGRGQRSEDRSGPVPAVRRARDHRIDHPDLRPQAGQW
jgi:hypothetical protein